ncbi:FMN reductase [Phenylobacterium sp. Root77]|nr:FMN reductase [Phenylobacterium sp. Root1277]KQW95901.1 FMN reductase [Phenylobacterium sp. Root1290]KRC39016.1 FMN reductase [Phenylobacterium sp. Root77]
MTPSHRPNILGLGGTVRAGSSTERALVAALEVAASAGAETKLLGGAFLATLPIFDPRPGGPTPEQAELAEAVVKADGIILATPGYHGSISGAMKNALDTLDLLRLSGHPFLDGKAVGIIVTAAGSQAGGTSLVTMRAVIHALRGWPTPFGATLNSATPLFDEGGACCSPKDATQLATVAEQVVEFAMMKAALQAQQAASRNDRI